MLSRAWKTSLIRPHTVSILEYRLLPEYWQLITYVFFREKFDLFKLQIVFSKLRISHNSSWVIFISFWCVWSMITLHFLTFADFGTCKCRLLGSGRDGEVDWCMIQASKNWSIFTKIAENSVRIAAPPSLAPLLTRIVAWNCSSILEHDSWTRAGSGNVTLRMHKNKELRA